MSWRRGFRHHLPPNAPYLNLARIRCDDTSSAGVDPARPDQRPWNLERFTEDDRTAVST